MASGTVGLARLVHDIDLEVATFRREEAGGIAMTHKEEVALLDDLHEGFRRRGR